MGTLVDVIGICEVCDKGIVIPARIAEKERGRTKRRFCTKNCRNLRKKGVSAQK